MAANIDEFHSVFNVAWISPWLLLQLYSLKHLTPGSQEGIILTVKLCQPFCNTLNTYVCATCLRMYIICTRNLMS